MRLRLPVRVTGRASSPRARAARAGPSSPKRRAASRRSSAASWPSRVKPAAFSRRTSAGPTPGSSATGCRRQPAPPPRRADHREAARLVAVRGDLGQQPVARQADRDGDPDLALHLAREAGQHDRGRRACSASVPDRSSTASSIDSGCTSGVSASISARTCARGGDVLRHVRLDHHGVRAGRQRLEHRHGAAHAVGARDVAGGRDHAALAAADDHRPGQQLRPVALLHRGVEGVAVDMRDGQREQLGMGAARGASRRRGSAGDRRVLPHGRSRGRARACQAPAINPRRRTAGPTAAPRRARRSCRRARRAARRGHGVGEDIARP